MDATRFTDSRTGALVRANTPTPDLAFVPEMLPPSRWAFPTSLFPLLIQARELLGKLDGIGRIIPNPELLLRPLQNREALTSSSLEGTFATPADLLLYAESPREPRSAGDPVNAWREVFNYGLAIREGCDALTKAPLSLNVMREMHRRMLTGVRGKESAPGEFRRLQVAIGSDRRYVPPPAQYLADLLDNLQTYINKPDPAVDPLVRCFVAHYQFEAIHPFLDGNGRIGRAVLALMIYQSFDHMMPWLYLSAFYERHKDEYVDTMFRVSTHGDWERWIAFCLRGTIDQATDSIRRCEALERIRRRYHKLVEKDCTSRTHNILDRLFSSPFVTIASLARIESIAYQTAKLDIRYLEKKGILTPLSTLRPATFYAHDIFAIAYQNDSELTPMPGKQGPPERPAPPEISPGHNETPIATSPETPEPPA